MFTRRHFLATTAVFTVSVGAPQLLRAQTIADDLTNLDDEELRQRFRQAKSGEERRRIRAELERRSSGGTINWQPAETQPSTDAPVSAEQPLTQEQEQDLRRRWSDAQTPEEREQLRQEYRKSTGKEPDATEAGRSRTTTTQEPAPSRQSPSTDETPTIDQALPPDNNQLTTGEREEFKARMRAAQTNEERKEIRREYRALIKQRAHTRGQGAERSGGKGKGGSGQQGKSKDQSETPPLLLEEEGKGKGKGKGKKK